MFNTMSTHTLATDPKHIDQKNFQRLFRLTFVLFLLVAVFHRLLPRSWRPFRSSLEGHETVFDEARRTANTILPFVFVR